VHILLHKLLEDAVDDCCCCVHPALVP
jgi:hypothetical protein